MNDRKTDESTPLAPHRPLTGPKTPRPNPAAGVSQAPPRWSPNGGEPPAQPKPRQQQRPPRSQQQSSSPSRPGTTSKQAPKNPASQSRPAPAGPPPSEVKPGPPAGGSEPRPTPPPRKPPASAGGPPTEAMPRINAPTLQPSAPPPGPPPNSVAKATRPGPATDPRTAPTTTSRPRGRPRRARLRLVRVDPWSVMKIAFALSIALAIVTVVAVSIVWAVLGAAGVWDSINSSVAVVLSDNSSDFDIRDYVGMGRVVGLTMIVAAADVILITAIATLGAFLYNLAATMLGGLELTLSEDRTGTHSQP